MASYWFLVAEPAWGDTPTAVFSFSQKLRMDHLGIKDYPLEAPWEGALYT